MIITAFLLGSGPGILCAVLSGVAAWYGFVAPVHGFSLDGPSALALGFFAAIVAVDIALIHFMRRATRHLAGQREVTAGLLRQQRLMFQELQHRVANNMTFVSALLYMQRRKVAGDPGRAEAALDEASSRLNVMSRIHRRLYDPAAVALPVRQYFQEICGDLLDATAARDVSVSVEMPAVRMEIDRLMTLSLFVTEVVTNSLKHAFTGRPGGRITLSLEEMADGRMALTIADDGRGLPPEGERAAGRGNGLGTRIIQGLAKQLGGELTVTGEGGTCTRLVFSAA